MSSLFAPRRLLALVTLVYAVNFLDRQILGIALPQIRNEFHLSDTALGLLAGPAFALVYTLFGIPLAVLADRGRRRALIAGSLFVFSAATMLCGMAGSFPQFLAARFVTGLGEAGTTPAMNALIGEVYPPERRTGALSFYSAGANLGLLVAFFGGGLIVQHWGWRVAFFAAGVPGLVLAFVFLGLHNLPRDAIFAATPPTVHVRFRETVRFFWARRSFRFVALACALISVSGYAEIALGASFLVRSHHMTLSTIGLVFALSSGVLGLLGTALTGAAVDRYDRGDPRAGLYAAMAATACAQPCFAIFYLAPDRDIAIAGLAAASFFATAYLGPGFAVAQSLSPPRLRAQAAALLLLILNLAGLGLGPQLAGVISDLLRPRLGEEALRYALLMGILPCSLALWCFWQASKSLMADIAQTH